MTKLTGITLRISCSLCGETNPKNSKMIFNSLEDIEIHISQKCTRCKAQINQWYWTEIGADKELRLCIGNREDSHHPIATLSGTLTTNGEFDPLKFKHWVNNGIRMIIPKELDL